MRSIESSTSYVAYVPLRRKNPIESGEGDEDNDDHDDEDDKGIDAEITPAEPKDVRPESRTTSTAASTT